MVKDAMESIYILPGYMQERVTNSLCYRKKVSSGVSLPFAVDLHLIGEGLGTGHHATLMCSVHVPCRPTVCVLG